MITYELDDTIRKVVSGGKDVFLTGWNYKGLSTDTKPTDANNGASFLEMDTKKTYYYDAAGNQWLEQ